MATPRLLLVESSHMIRVRNHLKTTPPGLVYFLLDQPGLKARDGLEFVEEHFHATKRFQPIHVIILLGGNYLQPKTIEEPAGSMRDTFEHLKTISKWIKREFQVKVMYSELLPHPRRPTPPGHKLPDIQHRYNQRWKTHNRRLAQARNHAYGNLGEIIHHPALWKGNENAHLHYFGTDSIKYWGLHLNRDGTKIITDDFFKAICWAVTNN